MITKVVPVQWLTWLYSEYLCLFIFVICFAVKNNKEKTFKDKQIYKVQKRFNFIVITYIFISYKKV